MAADITVILLGVIGAAVMSQTNPALRVLSVGVMLTFPIPYGELVLTFGYLVALGIVWPTDAINRALRWPA